MTEAEFQEAIRGLTSLDAWVQGWRPSEELKASKDKELEAEELEAFWRSQLVGGGA